jgi:hypothetical protein
MSRIGLIVGSLAMMPALAILSYPAQTVSAPGIGAVRVAANPQNYHGPCPATIKFMGAIEIRSYPVILTCQWQRSDGANGKVRTVRVTSANTKTLVLSDIWRVGSGRRQIWEKLRVRSGKTDVTSAAANAIVNCR